MKQHIFLFTMDMTLDGGVERVVSNMANSFSKRGYRVDIISLFKANESIKYHLDEKIKVKFLFDNLSFESWHNSLLVKFNLYWRYKLALKFTDKLYHYIDHVEYLSNHATLSSSQCPYHRFRSLSLSVW